MADPAPGRVCQTAPTAIGALRAESPQWRRGPAAKPILCNACGTRYRRTQQLAPLAPSVGGRASTRKRRATAAEREDEPVGASSLPCIACFASELHFSGTQAIDRHLPVLMFSGYAFCVRFGISTPLFR